MEKLITFLLWITIFIFVMVMIHAGLSWVYRDRPICSGVSLSHASEIRVTAVDAKQNASALGSNPERS